MRARFGWTLALGMLLAGCGVAGGPLTQGGGLFRGLDTTIVDLPGMPLNQQLNLTGKFQKYSLTGNGTITALDASHLAVSAQIVAHWGFFSQTKDVTFAIANQANPQWPYQFQALNVTDNQAYTHQASLVSHTTGKSTFKLDDNSTAVVTADGKGSAEIVYGDFDLTLGSGRKLLAPIQNPPSKEHFFDLH